MKSISKILWGAVLIVLGLIMAVNALGFETLNIFFDGWWTLFIIVPSLIGLIDGDDRGGALIGLLIGVGLLLAAQDIISFGLLFKLLVPFIIVAIGVSVLCNGIFGKKVKEKVVIQNSDDLEEIAVVMSDENKVIKGDFKGSVIDTVFGHCNLDLREAKIKDSASLKISSVFGKVDVILPEGVTIKMNSTKVFGSVNSVEKSNSSSKKEKILYIEATSVFGGISLR